jgi:hypothetical protein
MDRRLSELERLAAEGPENYKAVIEAADPVITDESLPMADRVRALQLLENVIGDGGEIAETDVHEYVKTVIG